MVAFGTVRFFRYTCLIALPLTVTLALLSPAQAQRQDAGDPQQDLTDPNNLRPLGQDDTILSLQGGQRLMNEAKGAIASQNYALASKKLQNARQVFNQLSNFYQQLASSFSGIDNRLADEHRKKALDTAQMRDEATYQLSLVHRAQNQPELSVPLLIQIIRSQNPTRDLGKKAYQQLLELGFVETAFPRPNQPTSSTPPQRK